MDQVVQTTNYMGLLCAETDTAVSQGLWIRATEAWSWLAVKGPQGGTMGQRRPDVNRD